MSYTRAIAAIATVLAALSSVRGDPSPTCYGSAFGGTDAPCTGYISQFCNEAVNEAAASGKTYIYRCYDQGFWHGDNSCSMSIESYKDNATASVDDCVRIMNDVSVACTMGGFGTADPDNAVKYKYFPLHVDGCSSD